MASIDQFKAQLLGGGPRANRFRVFIPRSGNKIEFLCQSAQIPAATVGVVEQQFRGHVLKLAGDRTFEPWTVTIINDVEFSSRSALEAWQTDIQQLDSGEGITSLDYLVDRAFVEQLNKDDSLQKEVYSTQLNLANKFINIDSDLSVKNIIEHIIN